MTPATGYAALVRDALAARHLTRSGCFVSNRSCGKLADIGVPALSAIERVVVDDVLPCYHCPAAFLDHRFPGLASVLVTYFAIGRDAGNDRVVAFFDRLYGSVRVEAMRAVNVVWLLRSPTAPVPDAIMGEIRRLAEEGTGEVREVARWFVGRAT